MQRFQIKKPLRTVIIIFNTLVLAIWSGFVFFWYMTITSDIPPAPTVKELIALNKYVGCWLLFLAGNGIFFMFTMNKATQ